MHDDDKREALRSSSSVEKSEETYGLIKVINNFCFENMLLFVSGINLR